MVERSGLYSALHIRIVENVVPLFILRGLFVAASKQLGLFRSLPPRYTKRFSRKCLATLRIATIQSKLRDVFGNIAIVIVQQYGRENRSCALLRDVYKSSARGIQRVGLAFLVRHALLHLYYGFITSDGIALAAPRHTMRPLLDGAAALEFRAAAPWALFDVVGACGATGAAR
ncbi:hypothetical protein Q4I28_002471 [Leishmania naiffi]|uniref:Uncharacterized protein n=1 Tax=Leishmania naiffi TaxID=5678 RepID=A0AAW3BZJ8_9TRYP